MQLMPFKKYENKQKNKNKNLKHTPETINFTK